MIPVAYPGMAQSTPIPQATPVAAPAAGGLQITDTKQGMGAIATPGRQITVHYTGTLHPTGEKFDSSVDRAEPFTFQLGAGDVIEGWDKGFENMRVGGKRTLIVPYTMAYGEEGSPPDIPPRATLKFDVELLGVQ